MDSRELEELASRFDEESFRKKLVRFARRAGRDVIEKVMILYYCLRDPDVPQWARRIIMGALAYFVLPVDAIPDITPFAGFADDFVVLVAAIGMVVTHIKPEHREMANDRLLRWFGEGEESGTHARV